MSDLQTHYDETHEELAKANQRIAELEGSEKSLKLAVKNWREANAIGLRRIAELEASIESKSDIINRLYSQIENMEKHNPDVLSLKGWQQENAELQDRIAELEVKLEVETKAAGHWMEEANYEHNKNVKLEADNERLLVLGTKWCDKDHHDWQELLNDFVLVAKNRR